MRTKLAPAGSRRTAAKKTYSVSDLSTQLQAERRSVDFDTFDISIQQLLGMLIRQAIDIAPAYQRQFRWDDVRCSQLVESIFLGIPVPSLFMATNKDSTWELVDGVQRISTLVKFVGSNELRKSLGVGDRLRLNGLAKLPSFEGHTFETLPKPIQLHFELRPIKVVTLSDKSDKVVRFDLFERLNTGGIALTAQEIRDCVYRGRFSKLLDELSEDSNFRKIVKLTKKQEQDGTREECVLRFFAFFDRYLEFDHIVRDFLNSYMSDATRKFDHERGAEIFLETCKSLAKAFPNGIHRPHRKSTTPLNLFEGVAVGAALAIEKKKKIKTTGISKWIGSKDLLEFTTQATNDFRNVKGRIEFCRDRFLGK